MIGIKFVSKLTDFVFGVVEGLLGLRIILKLLGANLSAPFVKWVYETSEPLLSPFEGIFPTQRIAGGFLLEMSALFALLIYAILAYMVLEALSLFTAKTKVRK